LGAVAAGAVLIEKHFTLNRELKGPDYQVSLEPHEFKLMVEGIGKIKEAMGSDFEIYEEEKIVAEWAHHSIVSACPLKEGEIINGDSICFKRPGNGINANLFNSVVGKKVTKNIEKNVQIKWSDLSDG
jgi:sialic acid synthase SpsE